MMRRILASAILGMSLLVTTAPSAAAQAGSVISAWRAPLGTNGANGYVTITTTATNAGSLRIVAKGLAGSATYSVGLFWGTCAKPGGRFVSLPARRADAKGRIIATAALSSSQVNAFVSAAKGRTVRLGAGSKVRCGVLTVTLPKGTAKIGQAVLVPGSYVTQPHVFTVLQAESWTPDPDDLWQPDAGKVFFTVLVRIDSLGNGHPYNPFDYQVRDAEGFNYDHTIGREPELHSGTLNNGQYVQGWVTFEVTPDVVTSGLTLVYEPTYRNVVLVRLY